MHRQHRMIMPQTSRFFNANFQTGLLNSTAMIESRYFQQSCSSNIMLKQLTQGLDQLIHDYFDPKTIARGTSYFRTGRVAKITIRKTDELIEAVVMGNNQQQYKVGVLIKERRGQCDVDCICTCPVGYYCKHAVATLLAAKSDLSNRTIADYHSIMSASESEFTKAQDEFSRWIETGKQTVKTNTSTSIVNDPHDLCFILKPLPYDQQLLSVELKLVRVLKAGGYGKRKNFNATSLVHEKYLTEEDKDIIFGLKVLSGSAYFSSYNPIQLKGRKSSEYLTRMLETGKCYFKHFSKQPLQYASQKPVQFKWILLNDGYQKPIAWMDGQSVQIFLLEDVWYFDSNTNTIGKVKTSLTESQIRHFLSAPLLPPKMIEAVSNQISQLYPEKNEMLPMALAPAVEKKELVPQPIIYLDLLERKIKKPYFSSYDTALFTEQIPIASIYFKYDDYLLPFSLQNSEAEINHVENGQLIKIHRNFEAEKKALFELADIIQLEILNDEMPSNQPTQLRIESIEDDDYLFFIAKIIPALELKGWEVVRQHPVYSSLILDEDVEWYSELEEESAYDYFQFSVGIEVEGEKINILPIIANLLKTIPAGEFANLDDEEQVVLSLPNEKTLMVAYSRIKPILNILIELFDTDLPQSFDNLKLSKYKAMLLAEMEKAFTAVKMRWFGGDRLRELGRKIAAFESIETVTPPKTFKATLRPYQQQGVNWLQFLKKYQLNGILADDMGLGKTVQTLAHLCIEKNNGHRERPNLIIAPTSLMVNWKNETARFAPNLKVLIFHGDDRKTYADEISKYDVILTTYPLLTRDKEILLAHNYHYVILDEAQYIKNAKTKSTQIVNQLKANHRLCLTGTPMENHLDELWSLFNFLMPGLLGDAKQFRRLFRTPIEKHGDDNRRHNLNLRVRPFLLRRQKNEVVNELPDKTEIIRTIALQGPEKDLYESIRLSMEKKVRDAIRRQGLSRSHIVILDALLKLRQVCCHPRLLKLDAAKKAHKHGSKLALLKEILPEMVDEGRKILIFSQFTTMLKIIEEMLVEQGLDYVKLTGQTKNRAAIINKFQNTDMPIFLISLKAGGTGLNLTAADTVIHYDPWWNPAVEDQATDRAHRIGQKKSVFVYKLLTEGTVEQTILEMQQKKRALIEGLFSKQSFAKLSLTKADLQHLFRPLDNSSDAI